MQTVEKPGTTCDGCVHTWSIGGCAEAGECRSDRRASGDDIIHVESEAVAETVAAG